MAWDHQARFSPDGQRIAYVTDAGGGDNVWVMNADGTGARAVTSEDYRLLNNPVWHPNGQYIAARKHYTGTRSAGSGEIWLYHLDGGKGVQLNEKPNWQKDLGEPALSPDGRHYWYARTDVWKHPLLTRFVPAGNLQARAVRRPTAPEEDFNVIRVAASARAWARIGDARSRWAA